MTKSDAKQNESGMESESESQENMHCQSVRPVQTGILRLTHQEDDQTPTSNTFSILARDADEGYDVVRDLKGWAHKTTAGEKSQKMRRVGNGKTSKCEDETFWHCYRI